ncbi:fumarylacetoacetate hydrolase family protein [Oscillospiraceae bacterium PP1C4]
MKLLTFKEQQNGQEMVGVLAKDQTKVISVKSLGISYDTMNDLIEKITPTEFEMLKSAADRDDAQAFPLEHLVKMAPIPNPKQDIICLGINYMAHAEESARFKKEAFGGERPKAIYFSKRVDEAVADGGGIPSHEDMVNSLDYEAELGVIIKKDAKNVAKEDAYDYVFGYTILNDVSARNVQTEHTQWYFGKSLDGFAPMGPWIVTADEFDAPPVLDIKCRVNGELRQDSSTSLLIFNIAHVISELSQGMTLKAGTVISMGTPAGVGMGFVPPKFLKRGDIVECEIERIGRLKNMIV